MPTRNNRANLPARRTIHATGSSRLEENDGFYVHMFREDITNHIIPRIFSRADKSQFIVFTGEETERQIATQALSSFNRGGSRTEEDFFSEVVRALTRELVESFRVQYEILSNPSERAYGLARISKSGLYRLPFFLLQSLPSESADVKARHNIFIPTRDIWTLDFPSELGGSRRFSWTIRQLKGLAVDLPDFWMQNRDNILNGAKRSYFDYNLFALQQHVARCHATGRWGWNQRNFDCKNITEYYFFFQSLVFARALAVLRKHLVEEINRLFVRLDIRGALEIADLPTPAEIDAILDSMRQGEINFESAWEKAFHQSIKN